MKIFKRVLLVTLILGALLIGTGIVMGASFEDLINVVISDDKYIKQDDIMISDNIENVSISMSSRPLVIFESEDKNYIQYYLYEEKETINFSEENQTLTFSLKEKPLKFPWISVGIASSYVSTVYLYLNSSTLKSLDINISSGSVRIDYSKHIDSVNINLSSGSLNVEEIKTKKLTYNSSSGSFNAKNIESDETTIDISSGSVKIDSIT
ncbi:MAG: DUF4097 family beta strand repeat-containing protein, partial [Acholeplasma sp.]|nr:DUF4097 family beta strand repeat-containing protein [Acholeplasma sp.]